LKKGGGGPKPSENATGSLRVLGRGLGSGGEHSRRTGCAGPFGLNLLKFAKMGKRGVARGGQGSVLRQGPGSQGGGMF